MLTVKETAELLWMCDRHNLLTYVDGMAGEWCETINWAHPELDMRLAVEAVRHMAAHSEGIPGRGIRVHDLLKRARQLAHDRQALAPVELPAGLTAEQEREWARAWAYAVGRGASREAAWRHCEQVTRFEPAAQIESVPAEQVSELLAKYRKNFGRTQTNDD